MPAIRATADEAARPHSTATPAQGVQRVGGPQVRGGHPQHREPGGAWGAAGAGTPAQGTPHVSGGPPRPPYAGIPGQRRGPRPGPRQDYLAAFDDDVFAAGAPVHPQTRTEEMPSAYGPPPGTSEAPAEQGDFAKGRRGRTMTGVAAAAITTVLAVVVAGQVATGESGGEDQVVDGAAERDAAAPVEGQAEPTGKPDADPLTYEQQMAELFPLNPTLKGSGKLTTVAGRDKASGGGRKLTYRVDVEDGLGLDGKLFAEAVQKTLTDKRSWSNDGARSFERVSSGAVDFVITLASPGTTAFWCAKSGLDTSQDNVSCDSASTERVMINAYRWAQGAKTFGDDKISAYRHMLINHEVGHRLGFGHVGCSEEGALAPVMMQQTKYLETDGVTCRPNAWPYPNA